MNVQLEKWAAALRATEAPVLVAAPVGRSGTTALQRLCNTDPSMIMYSEDDYLFDAAVLAVRAAGWLSDNAETLIRDRARFRENDWQAAIVPAPGTYAAAHYHSFFRLVDCYRADAAAFGAARWGLKRPFRPLYDLVLFARLLPRTRIVYVTRDIADCLRSLKSYKQFDARQTCEVWTRNMRSWRAHKEACLTVEFERLEREPAAVAAELSAYLSLELDASVLDKRVNSLKGYLAPSELTAEEERLCEQARAAVAPQP